MNLMLDGATRLFPIIGDPITQVKSPAGVSEALQAAGLNALVVPMHVKAADFSACMAVLQATGNVQGGIVTVPHKFAAAAACAKVSARAAFIGAVNTFRRGNDGRWYGDMFDGLAYVTAMRKNACDQQGKRALLVGAGGAGSAIAYALLEAGVTQLAICDVDTVRRQALIAKLSSLDKGARGAVIESDANPCGFDIAINATPIGMREGDPLPMDVSGFLPSQFVGDVITAPRITPLLARASAAGCTVQTGADMFDAVRGLMVAFLLQPCD